MDGSTNGANSGTTSNDWATGNPTINIDSGNASGSKKGTTNTTIIAIIAVLSVVGAILIILFVVCVMVYIHTHKKENSEEMNPL